MCHRHSHDPKLENLEVNCENEHSPFHYNTHFISFGEVDEEMQIRTLFCTFMRARKFPHFVACLSDVAHVKNFRGATTDVVS